VSQGVAILDGLSKAFSSHGFNFSFAIRSGGHTPWAGSANIKNGVTIDMSALNQVTVAPDQSYTSIGPGNRWVDVYLKLDARGLAVPGGRVASVGVGGLVTGGTQPSIVTAGPTHAN
jgi:FAD/FMN-containing dehydrogenase